MTIYYKKLFFSAVIIFLSFALHANEITKSHKTVSKESFYSYLNERNLMDQDGALFDSDQYQDHLILVNFVFTHCPSVCPTQISKLSKIFSTLPESVQNKVKFISISIDPDRDKPEVLKKFANQLNVPEKHWTFLTGESKGINKLIKDLRLMDPTKENPPPNDHRTSVWLLDDEGVIMQRYRGTPLNLERINNEINGLFSLRFK